MATTDDARLTRLEVQLAHTQRTCEQLDQVVTALSLSSQRQERVIATLMQQLKELKTKRDEGGPVDLADERPPHY